MNQEFKDLMRMPSLRSIARSAVRTFYYGPIDWLHDLAARAFIRRPKPGKYNIIRLR